ncbi:DinB family protein [Streptomyces sp. NBC_01465]|uniref:DinB family protein n=1 Tax=Streptomyces sp. NBC_01465 TaxID=2903878 RepID=UPI002E34A86F|nr:DinB family protein [Streptomyces sp. NBC_01465]
MDDQQRAFPSTTAADRESLTQFLQYQRETLMMKCTGLNVEQLREAAVPPSGMTLLGLVRHMAEVERSWFQEDFRGDPVTTAWKGFEVADADPAEAFRVWDAACAVSREIVDGAESLDVRVQIGGEPHSLRYIVTHMIEEYARHNGHADFLRERIDGTTGE